MEDDCHTCHQIRLERLQELSQAQMPAMLQKLDRGLQAAGLVVRLVMNKVAGSVRQVDREEAVFKTKEEGALREFKQWFCSPTLDFETCVRIMLPLT